jgi:hypothetical protein
LVLFIYLFFCSLFFDFCFWVLQNYGADKYYRFRTNPPRNYPLLSYVFTGSFATGEVGHASTQSPPNTDEDCQFDSQFIDLNNPCAVIDLEEPQLQQPNRAKPKPKGKKRATPQHSQRSSKRTATRSTDPEVEKWSDEWSEMRRHFNKGLANLGKGNGEGSSRESDLTLQAMALLNEANAETPVPEENYWKAAHSFIDKHKAKIFISMAPEMRVAWLQRGINKDV